MKKCHSTLAICLLLVLCLCFGSGLCAASHSAISTSLRTNSIAVTQTQKSHLRKTYIAVYLNGVMVNSFYPILINQHNQPYLPLTAVVKKWLGLKLDCDQQRCVATLAVQNSQYIINWHLQQIARPSADKKVVIAIPTHSLININGRWYLRYDQWASWLPVKFNWSLEQYALFITPHYKTVAQQRIARQIELNSEKQQQSEQQKIEHMPAIKPQAKLNAQLRYRLNWFQPFNHNQSFNAQYDGNVDIFTGTLFATGTAATSRLGTEASPIYWNYTLHKPGKFYWLQFGDSYDNGSLLLPTFNLHDSIDFQKLQQYSGREGFVYQAHTLPGTEIDVYHNGTLVQILRASDNGSFEINDPNAIGGDIFRLRYYYRNGTERTQTLQVAEDGYAIIKKHQWDVSLQYGDVRGEGNNVQLGHGQFIHTGFRYGITSKFTVGVNAYRFPVANNSGAGGITSAWQISPSLVWRLETLSYQRHTDYSTRINFSKINNNTVQLDMQNISPHSPINSLNRQTVFQTFPFPTIYSQADRFWSIKDTITIKNWQITPQYKDSNVGDLFSIDATGNINQKISSSWLAGVARVQSDGVSPYLQTTLYYALNTNNLIQLSRDFYRDQSQTVLSYRYQSISLKGWDVFAGIAQPDHSHTLFQINADWRITKNFGLQVFADQDDVNAQLSWFGLFASRPGPQLYDQFATGTVVGRVLAPPTVVGGKPTPVDGAKVSVGGETVTTNKQGEFFATGLPAYTRLQFSVVASSLSASLIADKKVVVLYLRPGTYIRYNPKLDWSVGVDGVVDHGGVTIPAGTRVAVVRASDNKVMQTAHVEPNGFFIVDKLTVGHYYVMLQNHTDVKRLAIDIKPGTEWLPNLHLYWPPQH